MRDVLKNMASLPDVEIAETPEDLKVIAERTLQSREKVIYYVGSVEVLMQGYERTYDQGFYISLLSFHSQRAIALRETAPGKTSLLSPTASMQHNRAYADPNPSGYYRI